MLCLDCLKDLMCVCLIWQGEVTYGGILERSIYQVRFLLFISGD